MDQPVKRKVPRGSRVFPDLPPMSPEEKARRQADSEAFGKRCREIFDRVYPELVEEHYNWFILIEPESGDYLLLLMKKLLPKKLIKSIPKQSC